MPVSAFLAFDQFVVGVNKEFIVQHTCQCVLLLDHCGTPCSSTFFPALADAPPRPLGVVDCDILEGPTTTVHESQTRGLASKQYHHNMSETGRLGGSEVTRLTTKTSAGNLEVG